MPDDQEKQVDESWKERAVPQSNTEEEHACEDPNCGHDHDHDAMQVDFLNYITSLGFQTLIFLGEMPNPVSNQNDKNLTQAKFLIDTLMMLQEKTKGNLNEQEKNLLDASCHELQLKYVEQTQKAPEDKKA